jgi:hypothetical protein
VHWQTEFLEPTRRPTGQTFDKIDLRYNQYLSSAEALVGHDRLYMADLGTRAEPPGEGTKAKASAQERVTNTFNAICLSILVIIEPFIRAIISRGFISRKFIRK